MRGVPQPPVRRQAEVAEAGRTVLVASAVVFDFGGPLRIYEGRNQAEAVAPRQGVGQIEVERVEREPRPDRARVQLFPSFVTPVAVVGVEVAIAEGGLNLAGI